MAIRIELTQGLYVRPGVGTRKAGRRSRGAGKKSLLLKEEIVFATVFLAILLARFIYVYIRTSRPTRSLSGAKEVD